MMEFLFTKESEWLTKWDSFVSTNQRGSHLVLSDWLNSYKSYGFDYEIGLLLNEDEIIGGFGAVIPKFAFFKFYIIPHGPICDIGYEDRLRDCLVALKNRAKSLNCCYVQFSVPLTDNASISSQSYLPTDLNLEDTKFKEGKLFDYIYCSYGLNWVDFKGLTNEDDLLKDLNSHGKRNIKSAYKNNLILTAAKTEDAIESAYNLVELNAQNSSYSVRNFKEIKNSIIDLINKGIGVFLVASIKDEIKGSAFFIKNGKSLTYLFGGTLKEKPDLRIGYFLHWEGIKMAFQNDFIGYNISMGGSKGVLRFKSQFNAQQIFYKSPHYYLVLNKPVFGMFNIFKKYLKNFKKHFAALLSRFNRD